ncbi:MAG: response regulator [Nitrospinae bacterium]|nr:response regulator [Nitrospinota bacterium]
MKEAILAAVLPDQEKSVLLDILREGESALLNSKRKAEEATLLKDKFVSLVSHDLRAPLAAIVSLLRLFESETNGRLSAEHSVLLKRSRESAEQLAKIVERLLDLSRLSTGNIVPKLRFHDMSLIAGGVVDTLAGAAQMKGIAIENSIPAGARAYADGGLLQQVFMNLVSNAIKFGKNGGKVQLYVPDGKKSSFAVTDDGVGINPRIIGDLFKAEVKTSTTGTAGERGTGLGLPFCSEIMSSHRGEIRVESEPGKGSSFFVTLPDVRPMILLVDDHEMVRDIFRDYLETLDVDFAEAENGLKALAMIEKVSPHVVITDINMPLMDGFELIRSVRSNAALNALPLIVITSDAKMEVKDKVFALGANDFVDKAADPNDLIPRVRRFLC